MRELIDRQAAIDAVDSETVITNPEHFKSNEKFIKFMDDSDISSFGKWQWANGFNTALVATRIHLKKLPSAQPEPTDINAKEAVYNLAEKIGIHQLFALTVELRGEPIQPEPHEGHWIKHIDPSDGEQYECSRCGVLWEFTDGTPEDNEAYFCPKCGKKLITK